MSDIGDIVICLSYKQSNFSYEISQREFPIRFNINSKVFIVKDNICNGYFDTQKIIHHGKLLIIKFAFFHWIKPIIIKDFWNLWQYRFFTYTPIKKEDNESKTKRFKDKVIQSKLPDMIKQYHLQKNGILLSLEELSYNN